MEEQGQCFDVGLSVGAVAQILGRGWCSAVDWDEPKSIGGSVAIKDWFVFECDVDVLLLEEVHLWVEVKIAVQFESHAWPMDNKGACNLGTQ